ncbi:hypothetical protein NQ317_017736 [Molorchus minor]|uniref:Uncharacterized protein n=1 Tax=Molorchus minor TaxID=1323400 RepID=A0ABQ9JFJ9_9CUCU|nr:hypothetical protein NQ317_017736 [Molorchus minor]
MKTKRSMPKSMLTIKEKRDTINFDELEAFLKGRLSNGYKPKKASVLCLKDIFILCMGYFEGYRSQELLNMKIADIYDRGIPLW